jgi:hypothetical protein
MRRTVRQVIGSQDIGLESMRSCFALPQGVAIGDYWEQALHSNSVTQPGSSDIGSAVLATALLELQVAAFSETVRYPRPLGSCSPRRSSRRQHR